MANWMQPFPEDSITGHFGTRSAFRIRNGLGPHRGTDWARANKTPIPAITDGTIALVQYSKILGWCIVQTAWAEGKTWYIGYAHLAKKPTLKKGDKVEMGQPIALMGNTGKASSGPHLHATLSTSRKGIFWGKVYDLYKFINKHAGPGPEADVEVELIPKNGNVVVKIKNFPVGAKLRMRKDGKSVWYKTVKKDKDHWKGVTLKGTHEICLYYNGKQFFCETVKAGAKVKRNPWSGRGNDKVEKYGTRQAYEAAKAKEEEKSEPAKSEEPAKEAPKPEPKIHTVVAGDTLSAIASANNTTVAELVRINGISNPNLLSIGQQIKLS